MPEYNSEDSKSPKIYQLGDEILAKKCIEISMDQLKHQDPEIIKASWTAHQALATFRKKNGFGRAIAAPQVGYSIRMIAMNMIGKTFTIYNPVITYKSEEMFTMWDDCLSFPDLMCCVRRHKSISVRFFDESGVEQIWENCTMDMSELLQHEIDHLDGILAVNIAVPPSSEDEYPFCEAIVQRKDWLENKDRYNSLVDYFIPT